MEWTQFSVNSELHWRPDIKYTEYLHYWHISNMSGLHSQVRNSCVQIKFITQ